MFSSCTCTAVMRFNWILSDLMFYLCFTCHCSILPLLLMCISGFVCVSQDLQFVPEPAPNYCRADSRSAGERVWWASDCTRTSIADVGRLAEPRIRKASLVFVRGTQCTQHTDCGTCLTHHWTRPKPCIRLCVFVFLWSCIFSPQLYTAIRMTSMEVDM